MHASGFVRHMHDGIKAAVLHHSPGRCYLFLPTLSFAVLRSSLLLCDGYMSIPAVSLSLVPVLSLMQVWHASQTHAISALRHQC